MRASARSRGTPPTAGVGWSAATSSRAVGAEPSGRRARVPVTEVPRWVMLWRWTRSGCSGTSSSAQRGASACPMASTTIRCSAPSLAEAISSRGSTPPDSSARSVVPASGRLRTRRSARSTSSSGLAPTSWPSGVGIEKTEQVGSRRCQRSRRAATSTGSPMRTSTCRATTTLATSRDDDRSHRLGHHRFERGVRGAGGDGRDPGDRTAGRRRLPPPWGCGTVRPARPGAPADRRARSSRRRATMVTHSARRTPGRRGPRGPPVSPGADGSKGRLPKATTPLVAVSTRSSQAMVARASVSRATPAASSRPPGRGRVRARPRPTSIRSADWNTMPVEPASANGSTGGPGSRGRRTATGGTGPPSSAATPPPSWSPPLAPARTAPAVASRCPVTAARSGWR